MIARLALIGVFVVALLQAPPLAVSDSRDGTVASGFSRTGTPSVRPQTNRSRRRRSDRSPSW